MSDRPSKKRRGWRQGENEWTIRVRFPFVISLVPSSFGPSVSEPVLRAAVGSRSGETIQYLYSKAVYCTPVTCTLFAKYTLITKCTLMAKYRDMY